MRVSLKKGSSQQVPRREDRDLVRFAIGSGVDLSRVDVARGRGQSTEPREPSRVKCLVFANGSRRDCSKSSTKFSLQNSNLMDGTDPVLDAEFHGLQHDLHPVESVTELGIPESKTDESMDEIPEDDDSRAEGTIQFTVPDVREITDVGILSPSIQVRGLPWKIMIMKKKARFGLHSETSTLGYFLQCNADAESDSWTCTASAKLKILPWKPDVPPIDGGINHTFYNEENDWGFTKFITMEDLVDPNRGLVNPQDYSLQLEVTLTAEPPHGVPWDSKRFTGFIGLKNQGATCYMNSLLQALYFTNKLRRAVYLIPTEADDSVRSVPLAIQRVFYELQSSDKPYGTKKLTRSFGWETLDSFMQHDAQGLCRVLMDNIDMKMKGTRVEGTIPSLFEGKMISFIRCKNVNYESSREESFMDIQLNVKDRKDVYESFADYVAIEVLDGDNKYDAGDHGLQDAEKGIAFISFPPVLHLQLKRFQFDPISENNIKINDRFEFPERLDLTKYVQGPVTTPPIYFLHAVLVHSGDNHGGHHVVYINPKGDGKWCIFDDDVVIRCSRNEAIEKNYGGSTDEFLQFRNCTIAYMLVYIAESMKEDILQTVTEEHVPGYLSQRLAEERNVGARRRKDKLEQSSYLNLRVVTEDDFLLHQGHDLVDFEKIMARKPYRVKKDETLLQFNQTLANWVGHKVENIRYWPWQARQNGSLRPTPLTPESVQLESHTVQELSSTFSCGGEEDDLLIFLEILPYRKKTSCLNDPKLYKFEDAITLFFRLYDPIRRVLEYKGYDYFPQKITRKELMEACNQKAGFSDGTPLWIMNDVKPNQLEKITSSNNFANNFSGPADIAELDLLTFQKVLSPEESERLSLPTVKDYFKNLTFRTEVEFVDKEKPTDEQSTFTLTLDLRMNYPRVILALASSLKTDPKRIQLHRAVRNSLRETVGSAIIGSTSTESTLKELVISRNTLNKVKRLYYHQLDMDISELESRREVKLLWQPNYRDDGREITVLVHKNGTVKDLLDLVKKQVELSPDGTGRLRLVELRSCRISQAFAPATLLENISSISGNRVFRVEEIPPDQLKVETDEVLMAVAHIQKELHLTFGIPFYLKMKTGDLIGGLKERVRKLIDVPEKEFEKYKFCFCQLGKQRYFDDPEKRVNLKDLMPHVQYNVTGSSNMTVFLGIDHVNRTQKRPRPSYLEKADGSCPKCVRRDALERVPLKHISSVTDVGKVNLKAILSQDSEMSGDVVVNAGTRCIICHDREVCTILLPCAHILSCEECDVGAKCPICQAVIVSKGRAFLAGVL